MDNNRTWGIEPVSLAVSCVCDKGVRPYVDSTNRDYEP
jgi:hypothetical protein